MAGETLGVPYTLYQCYKFPCNGKILKVKSLPQIEVTDMFSAEGLAPTSQLKLKEPMVSILEVGPVASAPLPQLEQHLEEDQKELGSDQAR